MSTFTKRIDSDIRDLWDWYDGSWHTSADLERAGNLGGVLSGVSLRFIGVTIPAGSVISSAKITFRSTNTKSNSTLVLIIHGVDEDNTAEYTTSPISDARTRTHTSASVAWSGAVSWTSGNDYDSPDITAIIQEIIDRGGWSSGNAIGISIQDNGSGSSEYINPRDYASDSATCALLTIEYTSPSPSVSPSVSESVSVSASPSPSVGSSPSSSESASSSLSPSTSISASPSVSASLSISLSPSLSVSPSLSESASPSASIAPPFFGLKIAKLGYDAISEEDPDNLIFSSDYETLKYYASGTINHAVNEADNTLYQTKSFVSHDLGYYPFFEVYVKDELMTGWQPVGRWQAGAGQYRTFYSYVTTAKLFVVVAGYTGSGGGGDAYTAVFKYKIYKNDLDL